MSSAKQMTLSSFKLRAIEFAENSSSSAAEHEFGISESPDGVEGLTYMQVLNFGRFYTSKSGGQLTCGSPYMREYTVLQNNNNNHYNKIAF